MPPNAALAPKPAPQASWLCNAWQDLHSLAQPKPHCMATTAATRTARSGWKPDAMHERRSRSSGKAPPRIQGAHGASRRAKLLHASGARFAGQCALLGRRRVGLLQPAVALKAAGHWQGCGRGMSSARALRDAQAAVRKVDGRWPPGGEPRRCQARRQGAARHVQPQSDDSRIARPIRCLRIVLPRLCGIRCVRHAPG